MEIAAPKSEVVLIEALGEIVAVVPQPQAVIIEVRLGPAGPAGAAGADGVIGVDGEPGPPGPPGPLGAGSIPVGDHDGDIIRYNAATGDWESRAEPFEFHGIVLVPMALPGAPVDGMVGFNIADNGLYVAVP